jgi:osmotically-inducible protein OsmY
LTEPVARQSPEVAGNLICRKVIVRPSVMLGRRCRHPFDEPGAGKTMSSDDILRQAVIDELEWEPSVAAAHIGVAAEAGVVTLSGHVRNYAEKHAAEQAVLRVRGVKAVAQEIEVQLPFDQHRFDEEIAAAAIHRLEWDATLPPRAIKTQVEDGWVTLSGEVGLRFQREEAAADVRNLMGVKGVTNLIKVRAATDAGQISDDITHALHRSWLFDPRTVTVTADGGRVRLTGTVRTPAERRIAASTAWKELGVTEVVNELVVS